MSQQTTNIKIDPDNISVPIGFDKNLLDIGLHRVISWKPARASPHILCAGQSGSGKTMWLLLFASRCVRYIPDCQLYIADPKRLDFAFAKGCPRFWSGETSGEALEVFHANMMSRINGEDISTNWKILVFDELAAFTLLQPDKKAVAKYQNLLASILLLGRGVKHVIVVGVQKALMEFFGSGGRAQFGTVLILGRIDKEQKNMLLPNEDLDAVNGRGQFYALVDGEGLKRGQTPIIKNMEQIKSLIIEGLTR